MIHPEEQETLFLSHRTLKPFSHIIRQYTTCNGIKLQDDHTCTLKKMLRLYFTL